VYNTSIFNVGVPSFDQLQFFSTSIAFGQLQSSVYIYHSAHQVNISSRRFFKITKAATNCHLHSVDNNNRTSRYNRSNQLLQPIQPIKPNSHNSTNTRVIIVDVSRRRVISRRNHLPKNSSTSSSPSVIQSSAPFKSFRVLQAFRIQILKPFKPFKSQADSIARAVSSPISFKLILYISLKPTR